MHFERPKLDLGSAQLICSKIVGARSDAEIVESLSEYRQLLEAARERGHKLVDILDIRQATPPTPRQRRMQGDWNLEHEQLMRETLLGFTFVVSSIVMRGVITAVFWIKPLPVPHAVFTDLEEAVQWGLERVRESGIPISDAIRDEARRVFVTQGFVDRVARR